MEEFSEEEVEDETRGGWYVRQMLGSANLTGSRLFHILSGNLSHQIEHHLFPDIPAHRYAEIAVEVREICARYGLPYNTGPAAQAVRLGGQEDRAPGAARPLRRRLEPRSRPAARQRSARAASWSPR